MVRTLSLESRGPGLHEFTQTVCDLVRAAGIDEGLCTLFLRHTSASLTIQENADPPLRGDISRALDRVFPWNDSYRHCEDNAAAHMKTCYMGNSVQVLFQRGEPILGTWQNVFFCEFDGPRQRNVVVRISS